MSLPSAAGATPQVSVIIRSTGRPTLDRALRSLREQRWPAIEIVLVNAAGPGHPPLAEADGPRLRMVGGERPLSRSAAANLGLASAEGEYLLFLDDDDWLLPEHLATLVPALRDAGEGCGAVYSSVEVVREGQPGEWTVTGHFAEPFDPVRLLCENFIPIHAVLFERRLLAGGCRFDEQLDLYEDWDFWVQLARMTRFNHVPAVTACYRVGAGSGFGVEADPLRERAAQQRFFEKWRGLWSGDELLALMDYARHKTRAESRAREAEDLRAALAAVRGELTAMTADREAALRLLDERAQQIVGMEQELAARASALAACERELADFRHDRDRAVARIKELEASSSWRVTAPLRSLALLARRGARLTPRKLVGYAATSLDIAREQGLAALAGRIRQKLAPDRSPLPAPPQFHTAEAWRPLTFVLPEAPRASIIIPVYGKPLYTFTCLQSILAHPPAAACEVIVVDDCSPDDTPAMLAQMSGIRVIRNARNLGFIGSCNAGAAAARGEFLVFLNNDTSVTAGWLDELLATFASHPGTGLVGARLIYPDGRLQEAGGIVWRDGSAWNYGRGDDPNKPEYCYVRAVDYCSGACLAIPRALFAELGMFDSHFAPAYYEDTDLAFRVRAAGYRTLYQPHAVIVHFEGVTSGTDLGSGVKAWQQVNHGKFLARWRHLLAAHRSNGLLPQLEREREVTKRALVMDEYMIMPDKESGSLRMFNLLRVLMQLGYKVTFVADNLQYLEPYVGQMQRLGIEVLYSPWVSSIEGWLSEQGRFFQAVLLSRPEVAEKHLAAVRRHCPQATVVFDTVDLHYLREERQAEIEGKPALLARAQERKGQELALVREADVTLVVSPVEQALLARELPAARVEVVTNIHQLRGRGPGFAQREGILFIGGFNHPPNGDAVAWFIEAILPRVSAALGEVPFIVVGSNPPKRIQALAGPQVQVTGYVADIEPLLDRCRISVAPLRYGAGVKGKINTSMSHGLPVVATPMAAEGMFLRDGIDVLLAQEAEPFADAVIRLYRDETLWERLVAGGFANIEEHFSFRAAAGALVRALAR